MRAWREVVLLVLVTIVVSPNVGQASEQVAEQPEYKPGDYWVFAGVSSADGEEGPGTATTGDLRLEFVSEEKDGYAFLVNGVRRENWDKCLTRKIKASGGYPGVVLEFPLKVGKYWKREYTAGSAADMRPMIVQYSVESFGEFELPSGKFRAFKIEAQKMPAKGRKITGTSTYFYSPEAKMVINAFGGFLKEYRVH